MAPKILLKRRRDALGQHLGRSEASGVDLGSSGGGFGAPPGSILEPPGSILEPPGSLLAHATPRRILGECLPGCCQNSPFVSGTPPAGFLWGTAISRQGFK